MTPIRYPLLVCSLLFGVSVGRTENPVSFRNDIAPILHAHCLACHDAKSAEGGYQVDNFDSLLKAGDSGATPIGMKEDETSELLRRLTAEDESERMPAETDPLDPQQIALIKAWIDAGAKFDGKATSDPLSVVMPAKRYADPPESYRQIIPITAICFTPDGEQLLAGGYHELTVWSVSDGKLVRRIPNLGQRTYAIQFTADGKTIVAGCGEPGHSGEVRLVDFESGEVSGVIGRTDDVVLDIALRPDSNLVAIGSADGLIQIIDIQTQQTIKTIASHADAVNALTWSDDGTLLASASDDKSIRVFEADSGNLQSRYTGHGAAVRDLAVLTDGKQIASTGADMKLHRWNIDGAKQVSAVDIQGTGIRLQRGEQFLIVAGDDHSLRRINLDKNNLAAQYSGHSDWVVSLAIDPSGTRVASGALDGEVRLWNLADGTLLTSWIANPVDKKASDTELAK